MILYDEMQKYDNSIGVGVIFSENKQDLLIIKSDLFFLFETSFAETSFVMNVLALNLKALCQCFQEGELLTVAFNSMFSHHRKHQQFTKGKYFSGLLT